MANSSVPAASACERVIAPDVHDIPAQRAGTLSVKHWGPQPAFQGNLEQRSFDFVPILNWRSCEECASPWQSREGQVSAEETVMRLLLPDLKLHSAVNHGGQVLLGRGNGTPIQRRSFHDMLTQVSFSS